LGQTRGQKKVLLVGKRRLPCDHHAVRVDLEPGDFTRTCDTCKRTWVGVVEWSTMWTRKMRTPTLVLRWQEVTPR
jgi:hypothetical protein